MQARSTLVSRLRAGAVPLRRRIPLPLKAILIGLFCGLVVWGLLEQIQGRALEEIFTGQIRSQLDQEMIDGRIRFDQHFKRYGRFVRLLAETREMDGYLRTRDWSYGDVFRVIEYRGVTPPWMPDITRWRGLMQPGHVLLIDPEGQVREHYRLGELALPDALYVVDPLLLRQSHEQAFLASIGDRPFVLTAETVQSGDGRPRAYIMLATELDDTFLSASQGGAPVSEAMVALLGGVPPRVVASSAPGIIAAGTEIADLGQGYVVSGEDFYDYGASELHLQFVTLMPRDRFAEASEQVTALDRRQRAITALAFIAAFTLVMFLMSGRMNLILKRIASFSQRALGAEPGETSGGDPLVLLDERINRLTREVLAARDAMRQRHETELRHTEALKAAVLEAAMDCVVSMDANGAIVEFNPAAERILGRRRAEVLGGDFAELVLDEPFRGSFREGLDAWIAHGRRTVVGRRREVSALRASGERFPAEMAVTPARLGDTVIFTAYLQDITQRRQAEEEARQRQEELIHVSRLSTMGEMATGIAHELNQPLSAIVNYAQGMARRVDTIGARPPDVRFALEQVTRQAERAGEIIRRLRRLVQRHEPIQSTVDVRAVVDEALALMGFQLRRSGVDVVTEFADEVLTVRVDVIQIEQVILNLLRNAVEAMAGCAAGARRLRIRTGRIEGQVRVSVEDSGPGLDQTRLDEIFHPFHTTKKDGMGMGLSISRTIIDLHGGRLWAEPAPTGGAVFHFTLPEYREGGDQ